MADYAPKLDQRESLTQRERNIIDRTLGLNEQLLLVTRPDPSILKVELYIHFGIAALILISSEAEPFLLPFILLLCFPPGSGNATNAAPFILSATAAASS